MEEAAERLCQRFWQYDPINSVQGAMIRTLKYLLASLALLHAASALAGPANDDAIAVIIGNKTYDGSIPEVSFAHNDADAFRKFVIEGLGYRDGNIIDLRDATFNQMVTVFGNDKTHEGKLFDYIRPGESDVTVFYSGHGVPGLKDKQAYLLPRDGDPNRAEISGYPIATLYKNLNKLPARTIRVFIDACFSGETPKGMLVNSASGISISPRPPKGSSRMVILTAAQGDQLASWDEDAKHGLFTKHLLEALYGAADGKKYGDSNGKVTLGEVGDYLKREMTYQARRRFGRVQEASLSGRGDDVLAPYIVERKQVASVVTVPKPNTKPQRPVKPVVGIYSTGRQPGTVFKDCDDCPEMVVIPPGSFRMGDPSEDAHDDEKQVHRVGIDYAFAVGKFEVTQAQWRSIMTSNPSRFNGDDRPVENVSWYEAQEYLERLNSLLGLTQRGDRYRLLSESEWEYVARAGSSAKYHFGNSLSKSQAQFGVGAATGTASAGVFFSNTFGLYDLHGNVSEWVEDCWNSSYLGAPKNGNSWTSGHCASRVLRGGSWSNKQRYLRSASRDFINALNRNDNVGFRIARSFSIEGDKTVVKSSETGRHEIQIGAYRTKAKASAGWKRVVQLHKALLGHLTPNIVRSDLGSRGVFHRLRAGPLAGPVKASILCQKLKRRKIGCLVIKPSYSPDKTYIQASAPATALKDRRKEEAFGSPASESRVEVIARVDVWVQITSSDGTALLSRILRQGDSYNAPNNQNVFLTVGNAGALQIIVDGVVLPPIGPPGAVRRDVLLTAQQLLSMSK
jgi:formylglycine-generating enzyme required for sulfatase activity